jgi:hypothetical protein
MAIAALRMVHRGRVKALSSRSTRRVTGHHQYNRRLMLGRRCSRSHARSFHDRHSRHPRPGHGFQGSHGEHRRTPAPGTMGRLERRALHRHQLASHQRLRASADFRYARPSRPAGTASCRAELRFGALWGGGQESLACFWDLPIVGAGQRRLFGARSNQGAGCRRPVRYQLRSLRPGDQWAWCPSTAVPRRPVSPRMQTGPEAYQAAQGVLFLSKGLG